MPQIDLTAGPIEYEDTGGDGPVVVLIGGLAIGPSLWDGVVEELRGAHRCIVPTLPWGAHRLPMHPDADLSLPGHARIVVELLERLDLRDVTLVENDSAMTLLVAGDPPDRLARIVITSCEAFDNYPPGLPGKMISLAARMPGGINLVAQQMRFRPLRRSPLAFGPMTKRPIPYEMSDAWLRPLITQPEVRRDLAKYVGNVDRNVLVAAAERLRSFDRPALVAWAAEDRLMPIEHGRRVAELLPKGRFVEVADSGTLIPLDQPKVLAGLIRDFVAETSSTGASATRA